MKIRKRNNRQKSPCQCQVRTLFHRSRDFSVAQEGPLRAGRAIPGPKAEWPRRVERGGRADPDLTSEVIPTAAVGLDFFACQIGRCCGKLRWAQRMRSWILNPAIAATEECSLGQAASDREKASLEAEGRLGNSGSASAGAPQERARFVQSCHQ